MRVFGILGLLAAAAILLVAMVVVGRGVADGASGGGAQAQTGAQKAYDEMKGDGDLDDPKAEMREALKGG